MNDWRKMPWVMEAFHWTGIVMVLSYVLLFVGFFLKLDILQYYDAYITIFAIIIFSAFIIGIFEYFNIPSLSESSFSLKVAAGAVTGFIYYISGVFAAILVNDSFGVGSINLPNTKISTQFVLFISIVTLLSVIIGLLIDYHQRKISEDLDDLPQKRFDFSWFGRVACFGGIMCVLLFTWLLSPFTPVYYRMAQFLDLNSQVSECELELGKYSSGVYIPSGRVLVIDEGHGLPTPVVLSCNKQTQTNTQ